ncbi:MAG: cyanophycinase [Bacteroidetes bacterium]|nr:cyanophycinase [Bacteroidota bacterium]
MTPKGKLLIIGGAEDKGPIRIRPQIKSKNKDFVDYEILTNLIPPSTSKFNRIEIITTASQQPFKTGNMYIRSFKKAGYHNVSHMSIENKEELKNPSLITRIENADTVFFSGGDQFRLSTIIAGSELMQVIMKRYMKDENFLLAGTSAGAMAMGRLMIYHAENNEAMLKGHVKITYGLEVLDSCIVDTHFVKRGRFGRLAQAVAMNPLSLGIGIGEDTALLITKGNDATCIGSGMVIIIDGTKIRYNSVNVVEDDYPLGIEGLKVHMLARGNGFLLHEKKYVPNAEVFLAKSLVNANN